MASWPGAPLKGTQGSKDSGLQAFRPPSQDSTGRVSQTSVPFLGAREGHSITPTRS